MKNYMVIFIVDGLRKFEPPIEIGDRRISYFTEFSDDAKKQLKNEMGEDLFNRLWNSERINCVQIDIQAEDETSAIKNAWINARRITNALSLIEFDQPNTISIAFRHSPKIIPNVLIANKDKEPLSVKFGHYTPPGLMHINLSELGEKAKIFNENIIRHIEKLIPSILWFTGDLDNTLTKRLVHSLYWYSTAMNQMEREFRFIASWFALESLVIESIQTENKKRKLVYRLPILFLKHNGQEINKEEIEDLWELRTKVVHEAISGFMEIEHALISAGHINQVKYFYLLCILFILDTLNDTTSIEDTWRNLKDYTPSINIKYEDLPLHFDYLDMFMYHQ